jgi:hypothetical protein
MNARRGYSLEKAINHWTQSMRRRTDESARREHRINFPRSRHIILDDVRSLNEGNPDDDSSDTAHAYQVVLPNSPEDDRLRVECCEMTKDTLNWSDTACLIVYLMLCTTILYPLP